MDTQHVIRTLDPLVVDKIAAGEVVERPAFAIKELVENSIDAGATAITVDIHDGGLTYFRVTDNGCGIKPGDIRLAFARHATSKLRTEEELFAIHTLGFRGEALASIAAVSHVELTARTAGGDGVKAVAKGGVIESIQDAASPEGTAIVVRDLFYNTPARRKFLKKPATEASLVSDLVMRLILARPDISFRLMNAGRTVYHSPGNGRLQDAIFSVLGREALSGLVEVKGSAAGCAVFGFVSAGEAARSSRAMQTFILNGRYVRNTLLSQAVEEGCRERVMVGKHPICVLHLTMPYEAVDVNVHPNKLEVRFQDERMLMEGIASVVRNSFEVEPFHAAPEIRLTEEHTSPQERAEEVLPIDTKNQSVPPVFDREINRPTVRVRDSAIMPPVTINRPPVFSPDVPLITQELTMEQQTIPSTRPAGDEEPIHLLGVGWLEYVFVQQGNMLYIIDQHAAHERILYERFSQSLDQETASQRLLVPQVVQLTHREHSALLSSLEALTAAGFDLEDYGDRSIQVRAVPMILGAPQLKDILGELADRINEYRTLSTLEMRRDMLVKLACRKAVKAGDALSPESIRQLIDQMRKTGAPPTCPHGRPLVVAIAKTDLDKRFRRIV